jgi:hypothetical protein
VAHLVAQLPAFAANVTNTRHNCTPVRPYGKIGRKLCQSCRRNARAIFGTAHVRTFARSRLGLSAGPRRDTIKLDRVLFTSCAAGRLFQ